MSLLTKDSFDKIALLASGAKTVTGTSAVVKLPGMVNAFVFTLDVTAAATAVDDTLDVAVQTKVDGTNWVDVCAFTQVLGNGGAKRFGMKTVAGGSQAIYTAGASLAADAIRNIIGDEWRVRWTIVDAATDDASFTFSVNACPM